MDHLESVTAAVEYIENNLKDNLTLNDIAKEALISPYYFHRVFRLIVNKSLMEYIRLRRLTLSAANIADNGKILDVAFEYGFNSEETYIRAFKKAFKMTPGEFKKSGKTLVLFERWNPIDTNMVKLSNGAIFEPVVVFKNSFRIKGIVCHTTFDENFKSRTVWDTCHKMVRDGKQQISNLKNPHYLYGIVQFTDFKSRLDYFAGFEFTEDGMSGPLKELDIKANKYAVFKYIGNISPHNFSPDYTREIYRYALDIWLPNSSYTLRDNYLIEFFDEKVIKENYLEMDIMLPIK